MPHGEKLYPIPEAPPRRARPLRARTQQAQPEVAPGNPSSPTLQLYDRMQMRDMFVALEDVRGWVTDRRDAFDRYAHMSHPEFYSEPYVQQQPLQFSPWENVPHRHLYESFAFPGSGTGLGAGTTDDGAGGSGAGGSGAGGANDYDDDDYYYSYP